jgi:hypothetical protein
MKNCVILGAGRSGTSMLAGSLAKAGYFMGENLIPARQANPKGFFEDVEVNMINEDLLGQVVPPRIAFVGIELFRSRPLEGQRWLSCVPVGVTVSCPSHVANRIRTVTKQEPYCFKDPRFCYTLSAWRPFLRNTAFVCVFREPGSTALSIVKECKEASYLHTLRMTYARALTVWRLMYLQVLRVHRYEGEWLFLHYNQLVKGNALQRLQSFLNASVDYTFPDTELTRSISTKSMHKKDRKIYDELCQLAGYK